MSTQRPMINAYEPEGAPAEAQHLVYRPLNDEEFANYEAMMAANEKAEQDAETKPAPLSDDELAAVRRLLDDA